MQAKFLILALIFLCGHSLGQSKLAKKKFSACNELNQLAEKFEKIQSAPLTSLELKKFNKLILLCSDKKTRSKAYKSALVHEFNVGSFRHIPDLLEKYKSTFNPVKNSDDSIHLSSYHLFIGTNSIRLNQWNKAVKNLDFGIKIARLTKHSDNQKNGYIMLSILFGQIKDAEKSIEYARKANLFDNQNKGFNAYCDFLVALGNNALKNYDTSIYYFNKSEQKYREIKDNYSAIYSKTARIKAYQYKYENNPKEFNKKFSENYLIETLKEANEANHPFALNEIHSVLGQYYIWSNSYNLAEKHAKESYNLALYIGNDEPISQASEMVLKAMILKNNPKDHFYLNQFIKSNKQLYNSENAQATLDIREKYDVQEKENQLLQERNQNLSYKLYIQYSIVAILFLGLLLLGFIRYRAKRKNDQIVKLQKHAMQVQMNPHFMFNSLNSINNYITTNNVDRAQDYLTKFAKLMRVSLKSSQEEFITLEDEIQFLDGYLTLEQLRNPNFDFSFVISDSIKSLKIPPLLIQPLLENSIIHGFKRLSHRGNLILEIKRNKEHLVVKLIDNGWGLIETAEKKGDHKSFATQIQQDRLKLYSKEYGKISYSEGMEGFATPGTCVSFQLPIIK